MRDLGLILRRLASRRLRTAATVVGMTLCVFLLAALGAALGGIRDGLEQASPRRLVTRHALGLANSIPSVYRQQIAALPGVETAAVSNWFFGFRGTPPDWASYFPNLAVSDEYLELHPEILVAAADREAWLADARGALVGVATAETFGWKTGDVIQLTSILPPNKRPDGTPFELVVSGLFAIDESRGAGADPQLLLFHNRYLEEGADRYRTKTIEVGLVDPSRAGAVARAVDDLFANSEAPTRTETEAAFRASFVEVAGGLASLLYAIGGALAFTVLLVSANTLAMSVRERRREIAVLKTVGFGRRRIVGQILGEALIMAGAAGAAGALLAHLAVRALPDLPIVGSAFGRSADLGLSAGGVVTAVGLALALGLVAGLLPALAAYRAPIVSTLREV